MARFDLTEEAKSDLAAIGSYTIRRWDKAQADKYLDAIEGRLDQPARQPSLGRSREKLAPGLVSFPIESHVVYYLRADFEIIVVRVLHKRQEPHRYIGERS